MACILDSGIDQLTFDLIVQLQLQDADLYFESSKGKSRDPTDEELAFQLQNEEWGNISQYLQDRRMAMSFAAAVQADGHVLAETLVEEENASKDRTIAHQWTEDGCVMPSNELDLVPEALDDETLAKLQILYVNNMEDYNTIGDLDTTDCENECAESSAQAIRRASRSLPRARRCVACREPTDFVNVVRAPCRHEYCRSCLADLFKASMTDESLFPPRCCRQPINLTIARIFLDSALVDQYEKKKVEYETPNRTYCYSSNCGAFINMSYIDGEAATCPDCGHTTCTNCKRRAHTGDCPDDTALQQLLVTAQQNGWQRCFSCWRMVELDHGCNHMTCRCGAQFCYNCGSEWKNCQCEQWNEHHLLARAYQIIDREADQPATVAVPQDIDEAILEDQLVPAAYEQPHSPTQQTQHDVANSTDAEPFATPEALPSPTTRTARDTLIARTIQELRDNHECRHSKWKYLRGPHRCEECSHHLREYIFECRQCRIQACNRCRRNRL
ncbi:BRcat and Rcat domain-containing protein [Aspergillus saccharolyticus JOP 1030-1]|uniref:RBR-type E3 ubiquitin transferase n=1 Tax=Aspergillus saccharolyticus JOP 1030-1 TaxID=1450539 RepID=A0A318Z726_9EURO|nr:RING finger protein [Aspergillus saccharolyticus JOP 1030-1]PYH42936.1 RING finger protein [Aspergillus saccharolyticus JOP 1030-1]